MRTPEGGLTWKYVGGGFSLNFFLRWRGMCLGGWREEDVVSTVCVCVRVSTCIDPHIGLGTRGLRGL